MQSTPSTCRASAKALLAVLGVALAASTPAIAKKSDRDQPTNITSTSFDGTQQQANSTQPGKVIWTGNVVLTQGTLKITGSKATGFLDDQNQITRVIVDGSPATVQQLDEQDLLMRGHASNIDYKPDDAANGSDGIAVLTGKAHVDKQVDASDKSKLNQSDGDKITYNTTNSTMTGESNGPEPVHMTFQPKNPPPGAAPAKSATPPAAKPTQPKKP
ncbi:MAG TPA: lipopolysaccharide transport periplasmic protein LptA [Luteibacter sp.]|uniref:lipopolysaccharide transport periplasmic protein LptA n=1 Tax=Luteibacter sp. TaxID=1886636 RepID=UPI002C5C5C6A|nr:lipopolysaccharide transport periplasmic protein LptA [Luteibacter sp.]HVI54552.1 lipopolysaccharide transport periplasmic protein LptA [Luteibacter sp.]